MYKKLLKALMFSIFALVLSFGISYVSALTWTPPAQTPPNGNVAMPINTGATAQTKTGNLTVGNLVTTGTITSGGDICSTIAGVTKCLSTTAAIVPAGTVSATASTCTIASGASTCSISFTWNITNSTTPNLYNGTAGSQLSAAASGTNVSFPINYGSNTIQVRNGSTVLASVSETASCASGTMWSGGVCAPSSATLSADGSNPVCRIANEASTCAANFTWNIANAASPNVYNATNGVTYSTSPSGSGFVGTLGYGTSYIYARDGASTLASISVTTVCNSGDNAYSSFPGSAWWNGSICDPAWADWASRATMPTARGYSAAAVMNNKIYVFGGTNSSNTVTGATEEYDPATNSWAIRANMINPRSGIAAATVGTKIYVMGGYVSGGTTGCPSSNFYCVVNDEYAPLTDTWTQKVKMQGSYGHGFGSAAAVGGMVYYFDMDATGMYNPSNNTWTVKLKMPVARRDTVAAAVGTKIYVIGGNGWDGGTNCVNNQYYTSCSTNEEYDTTTNTWATKAPAVNMMEGHTAAVVNDKIYVMGGRIGFYNGANPWNYEYNPATNTWRRRAEYWNHLFSVAAAVNNKIYLIGNSDGWGQSYSGNNFEYTPAKDLNP